MTERGLPIVDGAPACPFVAFDEDRDGRSPAPDHRHRCYAELRPAPRALAHQEAYCLSSAFPVCPTFQDWARREAAAARAPEPPARPEPEASPVSTPLPPRDREGHRPAATGEPQRNPPRDWTAPPPWTDDPGPAPGDAGGGGGAADVPPPSFLAPRSVGEDRYGPEGRGLAGSAADRLAGGEPVASGSPSNAPAGLDDEDEDGGWVAAAAPVTSGRAPAASASPQPRRGTPTPRPQPNPRDQVRPRTEDAAERFGPSWEQPRRYEAYPTLRTRIGIPGIPRVVLAAVALFLAAGLLFFLGPVFLGIGDEDGGGGGGGATPAASASPSASIEPTPTPAPTPQVHIVASGDTLSKIATRYGVTLEELLAANPQITNPDRISVGDQIVIPVPAPTELPNELPGEASPSP